MPSPAKCICGSTQFVYWPGGYGGGGIFMCRHCRYRWPTTGDHEPSENAKAICGFMAGVAKASAPNG